jgi:hypothetical protein
VAKPADLRFNVTLTRGSNAPVHAPEP